MLEIGGAVVTVVTPCGEAQGAQGFRGVTTSGGCHHLFARFPIIWYGAGHEHSRSRPLWTDPFSPLKSGSPGVSEQCRGCPLPHGDRGLWSGAGVVRPDWLDEHGGFFGDRSKDRARSADGQAACVPKSRACVWRVRGLRPHAGRRDGSDCSVGYRSPASPSGTQARVTSPSTRRRSRTQPSVLRQAAARISARLSQSRCAKPQQSAST